MADYSYKKFKLLLDQNDISSYKVSKDLGIAQATLSSWKSGRYTPKAEKMQKIADYFGVPMSWFYDDTEEIERKTSKVFEASAGQGRISSSPEEFKQEEGSYAKVVGDSMLPSLRNGDVVRIIETTEVDPQDFALVRINGDELTLKHCELTEDGLWVRGENKDVFEDKFYTTKECVLLPVQVVGKAVEIISRKL